MRALALLLIVAGVALVAPPPQTAPPAAARPKGDPTRGKLVFEQNCERCHDAYSREEVTGPGLQGIKNGKLPDGKPATREKILDVVNNGPAEMTAFQDRLTEQEKEDVVAFVLTL
jgi:mono/diheme cytochrome c family protein